MTPSHLYFEVLTLATPISTDILSNEVGTMTVSQPMRGLRIHRSLVTQC